ncbi:MAG: AAC(3) family N-acetyltransferase [Armatimonadota bacterium]|nr:AAC(3) family N-acetyltransferase [bacterium]MDW8321002.1 AAC(3) family N-acetyltransferase [Armatimonadota bacterium]
MHLGIDKGSIVQHLRRLGVTKGKDVLVHSSLSSIGWVEGGADTVIEALLAAVSPAGTILMPALNGSPQDSPQNPPRMDVNSTTCPEWIGVIPETFRRRAGVRRSLHPTHSVTALGARAEFYTEGHERCQTPCGEGSPYVKLMENRGYILLLGCNQQSNTSLHALEELAQVPYHLQNEWTEGVVIDAEGREIVVRNRLHLWRWERDFTKADEPLRHAGAMHEEMVGNAYCRLIDACAMRQVLLPILNTDPLWLLADRAREQFVRSLRP